MTVSHQTSGRREASSPQTSAVSGSFCLLVGVHAGTARRWLEGYLRKGHFYAPVLRPEPSGSDAVTWGEMVEARLLAEFRDRSVPLYRMRPAIVALRKEFGPYPLA